MLGAIIGDIVGSYYEVLEINDYKNRVDKKRLYKDRIKILDLNVPLFTEDCSYTDDSVLTIAVAQSILNHISYEDSLREFGMAEIKMGCDKYGRSRFGSGFIKWLQGESEGQSFGNGAAMRVSPVGHYFDTLDIALKEAELATIPSHNHEEAISSAKAVTSAIYLARNGYSKMEIKQFIEENFGYNLTMNLEELQRNYKFSSKAIKSVPQAIYCFLESESFEDSIRKAISIGGDSDTIAAICGSISEAYYGIPEALKQEALSYLPYKYQMIVSRFYERLNNKNNSQELVKKKLYEKKS